MVKLNCTTGNISGLEFMNETSLNMHTKKLTYGKAFKRQG